MVRTRSAKRKRRSGSGENLQEAAKKLNEAKDSESNMAESSFTISDIKSAIESALQPIKIELQQVAKSSELKELREELDKILNRQDELEDRLSRVEDKIHDLEKTPLPPARDVSNAINSLEQYTRRNSLRIRGIPEEAGERSEHCIQKVLNFCRVKLGIEILQQCIDRAHRVGVKTGNNSSRIMLVKFISYQDRNKVFRARTKLKGKRDDEGKPLLVSADLTRENMTTFSAALSAKRKNLLKDVWVDANCRIIIKLSDDTTKNVECVDDLPTG